MQHLPLLNCVSHIVCSPLSVMQIIPLLYCFSLWEALCNFNATYTFPQEQGLGQILALLQKNKTLKRRGC